MALFSIAPSCLDSPRWALKRSPHRLLGNQNTIMTSIFTTLSIFSQYMSRVVKTNVTEKGLNPKFRASKTILSLCELLC